MKKKSKSRPINKKADLERRLIAYSATAGAILFMAGPADAAKFKVVDGTTLTPNSNVLLTMDGSSQFILIAFQTGGANHMRFREQPGGTASHSWRANSSNGYAVPETYDAGAAVTAQTKTAVWTNATGELGWQTASTAPAIGRWLGLDKYVKLRFNDGGGFKYGWARISVAADATSVTLQEYGYSDTVGEAINTLAPGLRETRIVRDAGKIRILWAMDNEDGIANFRVERNGGDQWQPVGFKLPGTGNGSYTVTDTSPAAGNAYRVVATAINGEQTIYDVR